LDEGKRGGTGLYVTFFDLSIFFNFRLCAPENFLTARASHTIKAQGTPQFKSGWLPAQIGCFWLFPQV
jgi:hypothetical protein